MILSVILFVRYRNHFPVVQFQNQAHIRNPHGTGQVLRPFGAQQAPQLFFPYRHRPERPKYGASVAPQFFFFFQNGRQRHRSPGGRGKSHRRRVFRQLFYNSCLETGKTTTIRRTAVRMGTQLRTPPP